ncbi:hypothetical protein TgHK011_007659 [Trichoderma gracile]|nr:hypothetical protein TgHK011_007659 [Trichoderma gracile]
MGPGPLSSTVTRNLRGREGLVKLVHRATWPGQVPSAVWAINGSSNTDSEAAFCAGIVCTGNHNAPSYKHFTQINPGVASSTTSFYSTGPAELSRERIWSHDAHPSVCLFSCRNRPS